MPHNFSDDPNAFPGSQPPPNNTKTIIIVVVSIFGVLLLVCGGLITVGVVIARKAVQEIEGVVEQMQADMDASQQQMEEYQAAVANGDYATAMEAVEERLAISPEDAASHNNKAWLLATCPVDEFRDGKLAVEHATRACELTGWSNSSFIDTLAAAHAESGDFEAAAECQQKAIDSDPEGFYQEEFRERLALYQSGMPYREGPLPAETFDTQDSPIPPADPGVEAVESVFDDVSDPATSEE
ncbi:MAG: hypothetical protein CMJ64_21800 [Planctomycetaceae bacterium]|nr:hypothetical protein [Planctomycetaceae bacterium]